MFTKRPDKYTTGLINMRNDCFANSSIQAYSALPGLTKYLNRTIASYRQIAQFIAENKIDVKSLIPAKELETGSSKFKKTIDKVEIPLHFALALIVKKLQETQMSSRTISVWTFLHALERIFNAKISKSQHDAQELTQLINETLENENIILGKILGALKTSFPNSAISKIEISEFPFSGLVLSQMTCLSCKHSSKPNFTPFLMLTLHTPQTISTNLETLLDENESESIDGYQCLKCRVSAILAHQEHAHPDLNEEEAKKVAQLKALNEDKKLCINEDIPDELEKFVKTYKKGSFDTSTITSTVLRRSQILKPPKVFGLHLSRSTFNGVSVTRNACRVAFRDNLSLSIGDEYHEELKQFQAIAAQENLTLKEIKSKVLTTDVDDMEDADNQREDIDEKGLEEEDEEEEITTEGTAGTTTEGDDDDDQEVDEASLTSVESSSSKTTSHTLKTQTKRSSKDDVVSNSTTLRAPETLNNAPITEDQTDDLKQHFKTFKFNDNDVYKYRLKAVVRHQGSHTQGHYECYKRKPLYVKDKNGQIFKLSPEITDDGQEQSSDQQTTTESSQVRSGSSSSSDSARSNLVSKALGADLIDNDGGHFRRKLSTMMGRRPSVFQADPEHANVQEIIHSGLATPAEVLLDDIKNDYFSSVDLEKSMSEKFSQKTAEQEQASKEKVKMKKIPSLIKHPYWRISDAQVTEVSRASVLCETESVYMLYYERVDRKQVKSH